MKYKLRNIIMFLSAFVLVFTVVVLCDPVCASAYTYYNDDGHITVECNNYQSEYDFSLIYDVSSPVIDSSVNLPSGYSLVGRNVFRDSNTVNIIMYVFFPSDVPYYLYDNGSSVTVQGTSSYPIYIITNRLTSSGSQTFRAFQHSYSYNWGNSSRYVAFTPVLDSNDNIVRPELSVDFSLNVCVYDYKLIFNSRVNSGDGGLVTYYMFPSSAVIPSGPVVPIVSNVACSEIDQSTFDNIYSRGFGQIVEHYANEAGYSIERPFSPVITVAYVSSRRASGGFNPSSYGVNYEKLGTSPLFPSSGQSTNGTIDLKEILSLNSGVYASQSLKLVAVVSLENRDFVATYDFNPSVIVGSSTVSPSNIQDLDTYQGGIITDLQELANYIKLCFETSDSNIDISIRNMSAYIQSIPWNDYVSGGVFDGLSDMLPALSNLVSSNQLSLPDLTTGLAPFFNSLDITPTGNFANFLGGINTNLNTHLDSLFGGLSTDLSTLKTGLDTSITDLSTEINANTTRIFVPDLVDMSDRLDLSADLLSDKFEFADDIKDNLEDIRDTIEDSSEQPPDWSFTVYNVQLFLVDWSVYQPYRAYVQNILIAIAYILLFKHIYKTIPLNGGDDD